MMIYKQGFLLTATLTALTVLSCTRQQSHDSATPEPSDPIQVSKAPDWTDQPLTAGPAPGADHFPCSVFTQAEVEELLGNLLEPASFANEEVSNVDGSFQSESCSWLSFVDGANEITLHVSQPEHFGDKTLLCSAPQMPPSDSETEEEIVHLVPELGDRAWWVYDEVIGIGNLLSCSELARVAVEVSIGHGDSDLALSASRSLATRALASF